MKLPDLTSLGLNAPQQRNKIAVLMGGISVERPVSLNSGRAVKAALQEQGYQVDAIDFNSDATALVSHLAKTRPEAIFNALHGKGGEDGTIQGLLDLMRIPYTHSGLRASALAMDKPTAKLIFAAAGLNCPQGATVPVKSLADHDPLPRPYVIKPLGEGSSFGVTIISDGGYTGFALAEWSFGDTALVEKYIPGRELTVAVLGEGEAAIALGVTEIKPRSGLYDYTAKYTEGQALHICPADIDPAIYQAALEAARTAHIALGCRGVSRADFRCDDRQGADGLYLLEVNTQPGMTSLSLVPELAALNGITFAALTRWLVEQARWD